MLKTRVVEVVVTGDGNPPTEKELGYVMLGEAAMDRKPPQADADGKMPPAIAIKVRGHNYFIIGYTWDLVEFSESADSPPEAIYVLIVQKVPDMNRIGLVKAGPGAMDQIKNLIPVPGKHRH